MTLSVSTQVAPVGQKLVVDTEADATPKNSVTGAAGTVYMVELDNTSNGDNPAYLKLYDNAAPVADTDDPDAVFSVPASQRRTFVVPEGWDFTQLSYVCVVVAGKDSPVSPSNPVSVRLVTS